MPRSELKFNDCVCIGERFISDSFSVMNSKGENEGCSRRNIHIRHVAHISADNVSARTLGNTEIQAFGMGNYYEIKFLNTFISLKRIKHEDKQFLNYYSPNDGGIFVK